MKQIIENAGFQYVGDRTMPCCTYNVYHKTVDNNLCEVWIGVRKLKFRITYKGHTRYHINNHASPIDQQLIAELENNGLLNTVAQ